MNIENFIEAKYRDLSEYENIEFIDLYENVSFSKLKEIFAKLHAKFISLFKMMNSVLPTGDYSSHFWADPSRDLIHTIEITESLERALKSTSYSFHIESYYKDIINKCNTFLSSSGGSAVPPSMGKIDLYYTIPIFIMNDKVDVKSVSAISSFALKKIGEGSYAEVFKYKDTFYNKQFIVKRAKKDISPKEIERFKREFEQMNNLNSPYVVEVYCYDDSKNQYIMEYMDSTLDEYILKNNNRLTKLQRKFIGNQIIKAFIYIHSKGLLHRDISPRNILVKLYEDTTIVKVSDFGLVKISDSNLTSILTDYKGYFNDPVLIVEGFNTYAIEHEIFALTRLLYFVMTGKTSTKKINDNQLDLFVRTGLNADKNKRYKTIFELAEAYKSL